VGLLYLYRSGFSFGWILFTVGRPSVAATTPIAHSVFLIRFDPSARAFWDLRDLLYFRYRSWCCVAGYGDCHRPEKGLIEGEWGQYETD